MRITVHLLCSHPLQRHVFKAELLHESLDEVEQPRRVILENFVIEHTSCVADETMMIILLNTKGREVDR